MPGGEADDALADNDRPAALTPADPVLLANRCWSGGGGSDKALRDLTEANRPAPDVAYAGRGDVWQLGKECERR